MTQSASGGAGSPGNAGNTGGPGNAGTAQQQLAFDPNTQSFTGAPLAGTRELAVLFAQFSNNRFFRLVYDGNVALAGGGNAVQAPARVWLKPIDRNTEVVVGANAITPELRGSGTINLNSTVNLAVFSGALTGSRAAPGQSQSFNGRYDVVYEQPRIGNDPSPSIPHRAGLVVNGTQTNVQGGQTQQIGVQGAGVLTRQVTIP